MAPSFNSFGIIGAGAWGTALSLAMLRAGRSSTLWAYEPALAETMAQTRENKDFLPGIKLPAELNVTANKADIEDVDTIILATPAQHVRETCKAFASHIATATPLILAAKGIELTTHRLMSEVVAEELPSNPVYVLSGPSFAAEVARNVPTAITLASEWNVEDMALAISSPTFRPYTTDDIIGAQIGGALKNVLAIACGIVTGRAMGENTRAALITRGLAEIARLAIALGARNETLMGLSGIGDIVLTCSSTQSRNMSLGFALGQGKDLGSILKTRTSVTEGISTAAAALGLARRHGIDLPLVSAVDMILREKANVDDVIALLLSRPLRNETF